MKTRKLLSLVLTALMLLALTLPVLAAETYSITINNAVAGHTYEAYQIFAGDLSGEGNSKVLANIVWGDGVDTAKEVDGKTLAQAFENKSAAEIAEDITNEAQAKAFAQKIAPYLKSENKKTSGAFSNDQYVIDNLAPGYYLVKDEDNSLADEYDFYTAYIMVVVGDVEASPKGDKPSLEKEVKEGENWGVVGDHQIGDTIEFRIISTIPNTEGYTTYSYVIEDTMSSGLTSNVKAASDITIKVNDGTELDSSYYTVAVDEQNANKFTVTVKILEAVNDGKVKANDKLYIYYSGVLNENAKVYDEGKEDNKAHLEYSNNPNNSEDKGKTPGDTTYEWTFKMNVNKVDEDRNALTGAKFVLSKNGQLTVDGMQCDASGTPTVTADLIPVVKIDGGYRVAKEGETGATYVMEAGNIVIKGLDANVHYYLYETKAPVGYNLLAAPVKFKINVTYTDTGDAVVENYPTLTIGDAEASIELTATIENKSGSTLPSTGGMGTTLFYVVGALLAVGAGVLLATRKKMSAEK